MITYHSFSFNDYHDPGHMHFGPLGVLNDDWVEPGVGFPSHLRCTRCLGKRRALLCALCSL